MKRKAVLILDYLNISLSVVADKKIIDLEGLIRMAVDEIGEVVAAIAFLPINIAEEQIQNLDNAGFFCVFCPRQIATEYIKEKDRVDSRMTNFSIKVFGSCETITDIIIASNDGDFIPLCNFFKQKGVNVHVWGTEQASRNLRSLAGENFKLVPTINVFE
jgi:uncharacterized LabA/DUF88 family protein